MRGTSVRTHATLPYALAPFVRTHTVRVANASTLAPFDGEAVARFAKDSQRFVTVEDHWPEGGPGDAVLAAWRVVDPVVGDRAAGLPLYGYRAGTWGAAEADVMIAQGWHTPDGEQDCADKTEP